MYHIMHRGVRRKDLFEEEMDYQVFLEILKSGLKKYECILHAYCLMTNHMHLLLETTDIEIGKFMKFLSERLREKICNFVNKNWYSLISTILAVIAIVVSIMK